MKRPVWEDRLVEKDSCSTTRGCWDKVSAPSLGLPSQGPQGAQWVTIVGQHWELASIPKLVRDWSINAYIVILKNPVTSVLGWIETFPYVGALVWLSQTYPCLTWLRQLKGLFWSWMPEFVSPFKNSPEGVLRQETRPKRPRGHSTIEPVIDLGSPISHQTSLNWSRSAYWT
jgi:hypothetical protein